LNPDFVGTEPKEASYAVTVFNSKNDLKSPLCLPNLTMNCNNKHTLQTASNKKC
jgi:hypothetical protein